jgi:hypothetical protein
MRMRPKSRAADEYHGTEETRRKQRAEWSDGEEDYVRTADHFYQDDDFQPTSIVETVYRKPRQFADLHEFDGIPVIDRVPTAVGYRSQDSADLLVEEKSRCSRYSVDARDKNRSPRSPRSPMSDNDEDDKYSAHGKPKASLSIWSDTDESNAPIWKSFSEDDGENKDPDSPRRTSPRHVKARRDDGEDRRKSRTDDTDGRRDYSDNENDNGRGNRKDAKEPIDGRKGQKNSAREMEARPPSRQAGKGDRPTDLDEPSGVDRGSKTQGVRAKEQRDVRRKRSDDEKEDKHHRGNESDEGSEYRDASPIRTKSISKRKGSKDSVEASDNEDEEPIEQKSSRSLNESDVDEDVVKEAAEDKQVASKKKNSKKSVEDESDRSSQKKKSVATKKTKNTSGPLRNLTTWVRGGGPGSRTSKSSSSNDKRKSKKPFAAKKVPTKSAKTPGKEKSVAKGKPIEKGITPKNSASQSDNKSANSQEKSKGGHSSTREEVGRSGKNDDDRRSKSTRRDVSVDSYDRRGQRGNRSPPPKSRGARDAENSNSYKRKEQEESVRAEKADKDTTDAPSVTSKHIALPDVSAMHLEDEPDWSTVGRETEEVTENIQKKPEPSYVLTLRNNGCSAIASCLMAFDGLANLGYKDYSILDWGAERKITDNAAVEGDDSATLPTYYYDENTKGEGPSAASQQKKSLNLDGLAKNEDKRSEPKHVTKGLTQSKNVDEPHNGVEVGIRSRDREQDPKRDRKREPSRERGDRTRRDTQDGHSRAESSMDRSRQRRKQQSDEKDDKDLRRERDDDRKKGDDRSEDDKRRVDSSNMRVEETKGDHARNSERKRSEKRRSDEDKVTETKHSDDKRYQEDRNVVRKRSDEKIFQEDRNEGRKRSNDKRYDDEERSNGGSRTKEVHRRENEGSPEYEGRVARVSRKEGGGRREPTGSRDEKVGPPGTPKQVRALKLDNDDRPHEVPQVLTLPRDCFSITSIEIPVLDFVSVNQDDDASLSILGLSKPPSRKGLRQYDSETGVPQVELKKGKPSFIGKLLSRKKTT